ncbi:hypothetical protein HYPSUDRAFT_55724 [Hypholoma sublateritium FD-334 SS-4]|uniref:MYND-type domain-containing protein n=1 Tax=Hypholoma sublateritium (strain FD-334 SS-4) TaxID=945553 RepID=A0A0D2L2V4_HYPSF|nr:hypothetical protein HYPSUDRAFT_55724 [Hypholoma sublateritium FD-334 SS-4]
MASEQVSSAQSGAIYLPIESLDECAYCHETAQNAKLRLCTSCAEVLYCSRGCQKADWKSHKVNCVVPLKRISNEHPALSHRIINSPNPNSGDIFSFPNGESAKLVVLQGSVPMTSLRSAEWWPTAASAAIRDKLLRRILYERPVLQINLAACIALVSQMYTTTSSGSTPKKRRIRLSYNGSPISDFGIIHGSMAICPEDRLTYYNTDTQTFRMGQSSNNHYWIYFTTLSGKERWLDCNAYNFNFCSMVDAENCSKGSEISGHPGLDSVPAFFFASGSIEGLPMPTIGQRLWNPRKRFSILRDPRLKDLVLTSAHIDHCEFHDLSSVYDIMSDISGHECSDLTKQIMKKILPEVLQHIHFNMQTRDYLNFPKEPRTFFEINPGEDTYSCIDDEELKIYYKKLARKLKKGKITPDQYQQAVSSFLRDRY